MPPSAARPPPLTYLRHWKQVLWASMKFVYFILVVKCCQNIQHMNMQRRLARGLTTPK